MSKFSDRFKHLRIEHSLSQQNLADQLGFSKSSVNMYERGEREPGLDTMETIADYFNVDLDFLMGRSDIPNRNGWIKRPSELKEPTSADHPFDESLSKYGAMPIRTKKIPLLGKIACGEPIYCNEERGNYVLTDENIDADFCLIAQGDSMTGARIYNGDVVFIRKQPVVNNGEIAAVCIGDEATLKRVYYYPEKQKLVLSPENSSFEPRIYVGEELEEVHILGKAVAFQSAL